MRVSLKHPFELDGVTYTGATFHRAKAKHMVKIADHVPVLMSLAPNEGEEADLSKFSGVVVEAMIQIIGALSDLPAGVAEELDFEDLTALAPVAVGFLSGQASTGAP